jgi:hypothetical protein
LGQIRIFVARLRRLKMSRDIDRYKLSPGIWEQTNDYKKRGRD